MLPDRSRDCGSAGAQYSLPRGTVEGTVADCLVPFLLKAGNTWPRQRQEWDDHLKRKEISLPASSQHTPVHGGATGSLSQTLHLCNVLGQLLGISTSSCLLPALQWRRARIHAQCPGWEAEPVCLKPLTIIAVWQRSSAIAHTRQGRGDWGCNKSREAVMG